MKTSPVLLALVLASALSAQGNILAVAWTGTSSSINSATGAPTTLGPSGATSLNSLARHPQTGLFYTVAGSATASGPATLLTVDPATGVAANPVTLTVSDVRALAITPAGVCYAIINATPDQLHTVNLATGTATLVGPTGSSSLQALASDASGQLFGWAVNPSSTTNGPSGTLMTIAAATGATTTIGTGSGGIQGLAFSPSGVLYGANTSLYTVNTSTGAVTLVGAGGLGDVRGIEFLGAPSVSFSPTNQVSPGGALTVLYSAPGHGGEFFVPVPSCTLGSFSAPVLPQPLGIAWDACTDFYFNDPLGVILMPLTGAGPPGSLIGMLDASGGATGYVLPPATMPPGLNIPVHVTWVSWNAAFVVTVHGIGTFLLN